MLALDPTSHSERIGDLLGRLNETTTRLASRLERAGARAERATMGWTPAQVGAHVALVNESLASIIDGSAPGACPAPDGFQERAWSDVVSQVPARNEAPARFHPPTVVSAFDAVDEVRRSAARLTDALSRLPAWRVLLHEPRGWHYHALSGGRIRHRAHDSPQPAGEAGVEGVGI